MDLATIGGIAAALVFLLLGIVFAQGSFLLFVNMPSIMITVLGSFSALLASYPLTYVIGIGKIMRFAFFAPDLKADLRDPADGRCHCKILKKV